VIAVDVPRDARLAARAATAASAIPAWAWLAGLVCLSVAIRFLLARRDPAPWIFVDEIIYSELGRSVGSGTSFAIREVPTGTAYGVVYPLLIAPAYAIFDSLPTAYAAVKLINAVLVSLAAVPAYLLARRLVGRWPALLAAVLVLAIPGLLYSGVVMTENAFFPVTLTAVWLMVRALERPTPLAQLAALAAMVVAFYTRTQAVALVAAYPLAIVLFSALEGRDRQGRVLSSATVAALARYRTTWGVLAAGIVAVVALQAVRDRPLTGLLGVYQVAAEEDRLRPAQVLRWFVYHVAELDLWLGVVPFAALCLLAAHAASRRAPAALRSYACVAVATVLSLAVVVSLFNASIANTRIEERNLFHVGALFMVAVAWWVGSVGQRRRTAGVAVAIAAAAALPGVIPFGQYINVSAISDTFGLLPLWSALEQVPLSFAELGAVVAVAAIAAAAVCALVPARLVLVLPLLVLGWLAVSQYAIEQRTHTFSAGKLAEGVRREVDWIDRTVGGEADVTAVWTGAPAPEAIWLNEFFNRSVRGVVHLTAAGPLPGGLPATAVAPDPATGRLLDASGQTVRAQFALADAATVLGGEEIARDEARGMALVRVDGPLALRQQVGGVYGDTWSGPEATFTRYGCAGGTVEVVLFSDAGLFQQPQTVVAFAGDREIARTAVDPAGAAVPFSIPLVPSEGQCTIRLVVSPTAVPAAVGRGPDSRELGVHMVGFTVFAEGAP
jgi:hypothetical protein